MYLFVPCYYGPNEPYGDTPVNPKAMNLHYGRSKGNAVVTSLSMHKTYTLDQLREIERATRIKYKLKRTVEECEKSDPLVAFYPNFIDAAKRTGYEEYTQVCVIEILEGDLIPIPHEGISLCDNKPYRDCLIADPTKFSKFRTVTEVSKSNFRHYGIKASEWYQFVESFEPYG